MRPGDIVARLGGDEFVIVCEDADNEPVCRAISARVFRALSRPIALDNGETANIGTSIGIAIATEVSFDPNELLRQADAAMYEAKRAGKRRMVFAHSMTFNESDTSAALSATLERHVDPLLEEAANANLVRTSDGDRSVGEDYVPDEIANEATE